MDAQAFLAYDHWKHARTAKLHQGDEIVRRAALRRIAPFTSAQLGDEVKLSAWRVAAVLSRLHWPRQLVNGVNLSLWSPAPKA